MNCILDLYRGGGYTDTELILQQGQSVSLATFFNSFSAGKWRKFTKIKNLSFTLQSEAGIAVTFYKAHGSKNTEALENVHKTYRDKTDIGGYSKKITDCLSYTQEKIAVQCAEENSVYTYTLELSAFAENEICYPVITALGNTRLSYMAWKTDIAQAELNRVNIACGICTYRREDFVQRNVSALKKEILENSTSPLHSCFEVYISDNGGTLSSDLFSSPKIHIFKNKNLGGAAGFTRTMIEALINDSAKAFTHIILMDDDIVLPPATLERTFFVLSLLKPEYDSSMLGGIMLVLQNPTVQVEFGSCFDGSREYKLNNHYFDMSKEEAICANYCMDGVNYSGWWYCVIPSSIVQEDNLPMPYFIHLDDIEYGMRNKREFILMNGLSVWHPAFVGKSALFYSYYDIRNYLITCCVGEGVREKVSAKDVTSSMKWDSFFDFVLFSPIEARLYLKAMEDFLRGSSFFITQDALMLQKEISAERYQMVSLAELKGRAFRSKKIFPKRRIARLLHIALALLPSVNRTKIIDKSRIDYPFLSRYIFVHQKDSEIGIVVEWKKGFLRNLIRFVYLRQKLKHKFPALKEEWQEAKKTVTSLPFWKSYLSL